MARLYTLRETLTILKMTPEELRACVGQGLIQYLDTNDGLRFDPVAVAKLRKKTKNRPPENQPPQKDGAKRSGEELNNDDSSLEKSFRKSPLLRAGESESGSGSEDSDLIDEVLNQGLQARYKEPAKERSGEPESSMDLVFTFDELEFPEGEDDSDEKPKPKK